MQEQLQNQEEIQLFNHLPIISKFKDTLYGVAKWSQIIGVISMISLGISVVKLLSNINANDIATNAIGAAVGFLLFKSGNNLENGLEKYNQNTLQQGFRYLYRYFFISFLLCFTIVLIAIIVFIIYQL